jgi:hypothetical protein
MRLVICVIVDQSLDALLLVKESLHGAYWFPFDGIQSSETRALAAKRIASQVCSFVRHRRLSASFSLSRRQLRST